MWILQIFDVQVCFYCKMLFELKYVQSFHNIDIELRFYIRQINI